MDGTSYYIPMSTTEGCLVASTNRGCRALTSAGGVKSCVTNDGMSRGPVVRFSSAIRAAEIKNWLEEEDNFGKVKESFDSTSRYARLVELFLMCTSEGLSLFFLGPFYAHFILFQTYPMGPYYYSKYATFYRKFDFYFCIFV